MKSTRRFASLLVALCVIAVSTFAAEPVGTWTWSQPGREGEIAVSLKIESKDGVLTGALTNPTATVEVTELTVQDDVISFSVAGRRAPTKYTGKVAGDKITGTIELPGRGGAEPKKIDWSAKLEAK